MKLRLTDLTPSKSMFLGPICELNLLKEFPAEQFSTVKTLAVRPKISRKLSIALGFSLSAVAKNAVNDLLKFGSIGFLDFTHTLNHRKTKISSSCSTIVRASTTWSIFTTIMFSRPLLVDSFLYIIQSGTIARMSHSNDGSILGVLKSFPNIYIS